MTDNHEQILQTNILMSKSQYINSSLKKLNSELITLEESITSLIDAAGNNNGQVILYPSQKNIIELMKEKFVISNTIQSFIEIRDKLSIDTDQSLSSE